ncbi:MULTISPECIES: DUF4192 domain-containing protein [unclassified Arthrobacter]|uniref:DUF4192 domain-containing protein n=1 Tax=unclassified Arthrobacter TaxID=235627 RepID=UPI001491C011|nr:MULTISPECIES: DUF4192 domain-containing protein [unclassified Arthrobacter]MBE0009559.1 DUF4192 domain-containing protein [Arthrobacter sp. AET 35A]NOJ63309.1 DUF4192 domain-containing protein [Arthrobacter sp. 147(2020)]
MTSAPAPPEPPFKVTSPADILSYILHTLGFQPESSLVLLTMSGKRVGATLRVDLPHPDADPVAYATGLCSILTADTSADGTLMILYTGEPWDRHGPPPHYEIVGRLRQSLDEVGLALRDGWLVNETCWRDYFCEDPKCCPWPGHPLGSVQDSPLNAELVYRGSSYADSLTAAVGVGGHEPWTDRADLTRRWRAEESRLRRRWRNTSQFTATLALWEELLTTKSAVPAAPSPPAPADHLLEDHTGESTPDLETITHLLASLTCRTLRDSVLVLTGLGKSVALQGAAGLGLLRGTGLAGTAQADADRDASERAAADNYCGVLIGQYRGQLQWQRIDAAHHHLTRLSAVAEGEPLAALLTMLGWIEWARGRGSRAHLYFQRALTVEPGYRLAELLEEVVARGMLAEWSRDKNLAWRNGNPSAP